MSKHIRALTAALFAATLTLLGGCVTEKGDEPHPDGSTAFVSFSVVTPKPAPTSGRAGADLTWGDDYENDNGSDFDNAIIHSQLLVYITDENCTSVAVTVKNFLYSGKNEIDNGTQYNYVGILSSEQIAKLKELGTGKLHVVANAGTTVELTGNQTFTHAGKPGEGFSAIPMWGVTTTDFSGLKAGELTNAGEVWLLRAMAKVQIEIDSECPGNPNDIKSITSVTLNRHNSQGYLLPKDWTTYNNTTTINREAAINPLNDNPQGALTLTVSDADGGYTFYIPECGNSEGDNALKMTLTYTTVMGITLSDDIFFCKYDESGKPVAGTSFDIRRNHLYKYIVRRNANEMTVEAEIVPYHEVELNPGFGIEIPKEEDSGSNSGGGTESGN